MGLSQLPRARAFLFAMSAGSGKRTPLLPRPADLEPIAAPGHGSMSPERRLDQGVFGGRAPAGAIGRGQGAGALPAYMRADPLEPSPLSREEILQYRRQYFATATIPAFAARGYHATTIDDLVTAAGTPTGSLYELFAGKQECFLAACEPIIASYREQIEASIDAKASWPQQLRAALQALLAAITAEPGRARLALIEAQAAGPPVLRIYWQALDAAAAALQRGRAADPQAEPLPASFEAAIAAGMAWILQLRFATDAGADITSLLSELESFALAGFLAPERSGVTESELGAVSRPLAPPPSSQAGQGAAEAPGLARLPSGHHGLPREFVVANQRARLAAGTIAAVAAHGYDAATISEIVAAAALSRRSFYAHFSSKQQCSLDTYARIAGHLEAAMRAAGAEQATWPDRVKAEISALLEAFAANPDLVRFTLIAPPGAGGEIAARHRDFLTALLGILTEARPAGANRLSKTLEQGLIGGLAGLIARAVSCGQEQSLPELAPQLVQFILRAYLGQAPPPALTPLRAGSEGP
jgi:AcrR family transcriptional regulator